MSKVDTEEGLGPGSERQRKEVLEAQKELESRSKQKSAAPASGPVAVDKNAVTEPGIGKVDRKNDTVDDLLGGFGADRPNLPRILPNADTTPPPEPVKKELTPTEPGKRQRTRNMVIATLVTFGVVAAVGVALVKFGNAGAATPTPPTTVTVTVTATTTAPPPTTETMSPITTTAIESLPTIKTSAPQTTSPTTSKPVHSATTATATATQPAPRPTGSAPPGMNLLPDDPHR